MRTLVVTCLAAGLVAPSTVSAQWGMAAEIGVARFGGSSRDTSGTTVGPYRPTTFELRLDRGLGPARVAVAVLRARTGIAGERPGLAVVQYDIASLWEIAPQVSFRLARFGGGVDVRLEAGPAVQRWDVDGASRTRVAARAAAALAPPPRAPAPPLMARAARKCARTALPSAALRRSAGCFSGRASGSSTGTAPAGIRSSLACRSAWYSCAICPSRPCRPRRTTAWR